MVKSKRDKLKERFWSKVDKSGGEDTCWRWKSTVSRGRAMFHFEGRPVNAARVAYLLEVGEIPEGMEVCHTCDNMTCVSVDHLFLATHKENMDDMLAKGRERHFKGEELPQSKLTEASVRDIRQQASEGVSNKELARQYNVSVWAIRDVINYKSWKHVT